jgi:hypothetical protein
MLAVRVVALFPLSVSALALVACGETHVASASSGGSAGASSVVTDGSGATGTGAASGASDLNVSDCFEISSDSASNCTSFCEDSGSLCVGGCLVNGIESFATAVYASADDCESDVPLLISPCGSGDAIGSALLFGATYARCCCQ